MCRRRGHVALLRRMLCVSKRTGWPFSCTSLREFSSRSRFFPLKGSFCEWTNLRTTQNSTYPKETIRFRHAKRARLNKALALRPKNSWFGNPFRFGGKKLDATRHDVAASSGDVERMHPSLFTARQHVPLTIARHTKSHLRTVGRTGRIQVIEDGRAGDRGSHSQHLNAEFHATARAKRLEQEHRRRKKKGAGYCAAFTPE